MSFVQTRREIFFLTTIWKVETKNIPGEEIKNMLLWEENVKYKRHIEKQKESVLDGFTLFLNYKNLTNKIIFMV